MTLCSRVKLISFNTTCELSGNQKLCTAVRVLWLLYGDRPRVPRTRWCQEAVPLICPNERAPAACVIIDHNNAARNWWCCIWRQSFVGAARLANHLTHATAASIQWMLVSSKYLENLFFYKENSGYLPEEIKCLAKLELIYFYVYFDELIWI